MIIKRCCVVGYGTLNNFKYEFNQGINVINEDNGFGKTTLASFIKAMFYGLDNSSRVKLDERKKYTPWSGGKFGGSLDFEVDGKQYRVERFFGKTIKADKCVITDLQTNLQTRKYTENLGYELFGVDRASFEKSTFFPQLDLKLNGINDNIYERLSEIVESSKDSNSYSVAKEKLERKSTELYYNKNTGRIAINDKEISNLKSRLDVVYKLDDDLNESLSVLEKLKERKECYKNKVENLKKQINDNYDNVTNYNLKQGYNDLVHKINSKKKSIDDIKKLGLLTEEEISNLEDKVSYLNIEKNNINQLVSQKKDVFEFLNHGSSVYCEADVEKAAENVKKYEYNSHKIREIEESTYETYNELYDGLSDERFDYINSLIDSKTKEKKNLLKILFSVISILLYVLSFINLNNKTIFIVLLSLAVLFSFVSVCFFVISKNKKGNNENNELKEFINKYIVNPNYSNGYNKLVSDIYLDYKKNLLVKEKFISNKNRIEELKNENNKIKQDFDEFKYKYHYNDLSIEKAIDKVKMDRVLYLDIVSNNQKIDNDVLNAKEKYNQEFNNYIDYISNYNLKHDNFKEINTLKERVMRYNNFEKDLSELENEIDNYVKNKKITDEFLEKDYSYIDTEQLNKELLSLEKEFDRIKENCIDEEKKIERLSEQTSEIVSLEEKLDLLIDENKTLRGEKVLIDKTIELLEEAKNNLSSNYLRPMKDSFNNYVNEICEFSDKSSGFELDVDLNISVNGNGESFDSEYLSKGYQDLVNICIRLALTENVFKKEKPVLILDDPFVNLDEKKLDCAKKLLREVGKYYQIVYLICHESRSV